MLHPMIDCEQTFVVGYSMHRIINDGVEIWVFDRPVSVTEKSFTNKNCNQKKKNT